MKIYPENFENNDETYELMRSIVWVLLFCVCMCIGIIVLISLSIEDNGSY